MIKDTDELNVNSEQTLVNKDLNDENVLQTEDISNYLIELNPYYLPRTFNKLPDYFENLEFPASYFENNSKELKLLEYCDNFRRQYATLFPDRTRLLLNPVNECNVEKCVCTTINPTKLLYPEFITWEGAANFVADCLEFVPLVPVTELPKRLLSPNTTLYLQKGTCFEYATLLCSLLIGMGYDAYVVSGYATRECCLMDQTRDKCPFIEEKIKTKTNIEPKPSNRYTIKPAKLLISKFEETLTARQLQEEANQMELKKQAAILDEIEKHKPKPDPLFGLRVHAWILVLAGKREVSKSFFIETLTGSAYPINHSMYLGIESVWNDNNYWINIQDCTNGIYNLDYDLNNSKLWEYMLPKLNIVSNQNELKQKKSNDYDIDLDEENNYIFVQSTLDYELDVQSLNLKPTIPIESNLITSHAQLDFQSKLRNSIDHQLESAKPIASLEDKLLLINTPQSWSKSIELSPLAYERRYPNGTKTIFYKKAKYEKFSPYNETSGLVSRLTLYEDYEYTKPLETKEWYKNRMDKLCRKILNLQTNWIEEYFEEIKSPSHLIQHNYNKLANDVYTTQTMIFNHKARVDGLKQRDQTPNSIVEHYSDRIDKLCYREVHFGINYQKSSHVSTMSNSNLNENSSTLSKQNSNMEIDKIIEKYLRDETLDADEDVEELIFDIVNDRIVLIYHIGQDRIIPSTREFNKPIGPTNSIELMEDTHFAFQVKNFILLLTYE